MIISHPDCELQSIADVREEVSEIAQSYGAAFFSSLEDLLAGGSLPDVVCIATPNGCHYPHAKKLINAGCHIVLEKPMALHTWQADELLSLAEQKGVKLFMVMQNRFSPPAVWLKSIVESGMLGRIFMLQLNCFWNRDARYYQVNGWRGTADLDGGTLFTQFSHFIDIMYWMFGSISDITARMESFNHKGLTCFEDSGMVNFRLRDGGMGCLNFTTSVWDCNMESSMTVIAEKGSVKIGGQYMDRVDYCHIENYQMPILADTPASNDYGSYKGSAANHHFIIQNVVDVLKDGAEVAVSAEDGREVTNIIENIYAAAGAARPNNKTAASLTENTRYGK